VAQWLETALVDGTAHVYAKKHPGDGRSAFADLHKTYQSESKSETKIREIHNKLKTLQYHGAKNFGWDKFTNTLQGYYQELVTLGEPVTQKTQVRNLVPMITHAKTKDVAADLICASDEARENLTHILAKIAERMSLLGATTGSTEGGLDNNASNRQIRKMKRKVKALQKKQERKGAQQGKVNKSTQDPADYLSKETIEAIHKAASKQGNKVISWAFKGRAAEQNEKRSVKEVRFDEGSVDPEDVEDEVPDDSTPSQSASASMGQGSLNRHQQNPNSKRRKINAIRTVSHSVKKANVIRHTADTSKLC